MLKEAIIVGLIGVFSIFDSRLLGRLNFERPLITSTLVGLVLGDVQTGLIVGAALELISLGIVNVGAAAPPDMVLASIIASAFAILTGASSEAALTLAVPIAVLGQLLGILVRTVLAGLTHRADEAIEKGKFKQATQMHYIWGTLSYALMYFVPIFIAIYFGTDLVEQIVNTIPVWLTDGLGVASKIMPAFGFAMLMDIMVTSKNIVFLFLGFFITAFLNIGVTGVAIFGIILGFILMDIKFSRSDSGSGPMDDDFDDILDTPDN